MTGLPLRQQRLHDAFNGRVDTDVKIADLYAFVFDDSRTGPSAVRYMQQSLGPVIKRFNERAETPYAVKPGVTKQTYRLTTV